MYALHFCLLQDLCIWDLVLPPDLQDFPQATYVEMVKFLGMALVYCPGHTSIKEGWQYNSLVDFQLSIKSDSISFPDICAKSAKCYAGLHSSGCNLIINVHCFGESASKIGEFINNLKFLSIHSDGWFAVRLSRYWLVYYLNFFCELKVVTCF